MEGLVILGQGFQIIHIPAGAAGQLQGPPAVPVHEQGGLRRCAGPQERITQGFQFAPQLFRFPEYPGVPVPGVADEGSVEFLLPGRGLPHLEKQAGIRPVGHGLIG